MDDLIIPSADEEEGLRKLRIVLEVALKYGLEIQFKKCQFLKRKVEFLGHIVENGTINPSLSKTLAVRTFPQPTTLKQVQSFLGLTGYFRKSIPEYSKIAKPLTLHIFKPGKKTELHTYASQQGYGAVLLQEADDGRLHPVYYMSKKTNTAEEKYSSYELEVLAIVAALKKLRMYLLGHKVKIVTDCSAFQKSMGKKDLVTRIARWAMLLEEFDYEIIHRPGQRMKHVDSLIRYPAMVMNDTVTLRLKNAQSEDEGIVTLKALLDSGNSQDFFERNEILYKLVNGRELIVAPSGMQTEIIKIIHEKGHFFVAKTEVVKQEFFFPNLNKLAQQIATGVPRGNRQVERIHRTLIPVLTKLSLDDPTKWYRHVDSLQRILNSIVSRSTKWTPFELLTGVQMRNKEDLKIRDLLMQELEEQYLDQRESMRQDAKRNILKIQGENKKTYNKKRKKAPEYQVGDLVAVQRTQFGGGLKLRPKYFQPYQITEVKPRD
ncbi:retrovirus-related Pol polyprotein from transposon 17.6 [Trichonephila clavipes]|nr:retrovirus-related Pol polyprotein from transposon 17.6 [Trichonephila clavipes]